MKRRLAIMICLLSGWQPAQAQMIKDMSLSPEETMRQPNIIRDTTYEEYLGRPRGSRYDRNRYDQAGRYDPALQAPQGGYFMDEYCSPTIQPIVNSARLKGLLSCVESVKDRACDSFARLPEDAKRVVDDTTSCVFTAAQSGATSPDIACRDNYAHQLALLKQYWEDEATAYTILFLPDMLTQSDRFCTDSRP